MTPEESPLLEMHAVEKSFPANRRRVVQAVRGVTLHVAPGETLAVVGESGCGKTTLGRVAVGLEPATRGTVVHQGVELATMDRKRRRQFRRDVQIIFQDSYGSLNPFHTVGQIISEPWRAFPELVPTAERQARLAHLMDVVGLGAEHVDRTAAQLSGGQRQRVGIARALALEPRVIVCDEPVSALDVSIQAQIINLLRRLQAEFGVAYLFISHDLRLVSYLADRVAVMYLGRVVEEGTTQQIFDDPQHPYTHFLLSNAPEPYPWRHTKARIHVDGEVPSPVDPPSGCGFRTRCWRATHECASTVPALEVRPGPAPEGGPGRDHAVACFHPGPELGRRAATRPGITEEGAPSEQAAATGAPE